MNTFGLEKLKESSVCLEISFFPWIKIGILPIDPPSSISTSSISIISDRLFFCPGLLNSEVFLIDSILHHYSFNPRTLSDIFIKMLFRVGQNRKLLAIFSIILKSTEFELIFAICSPLYLFYFLIEISFPISRNMLWNEIFFLRETSKKWNSSSKSSK